MTRTIVLIALLALAACEQPVTPFQPQRPAVPVLSNNDDQLIRQNVKLEITGTIDSPCTGETIAFDGSSHIVSTLEQDADGATLNYHFNTQGVSGVGLVSGTKYQIIQVMNEDESAVFIPSNGSGDVTVHERIISNGSQDNVLADIVYTFTFPPFNATYQIRNVRCEG
ncbi:MAG TPA: hypothetical protein VGH98_17255 [Gemmatimonadaceae bacterium]|jgi:hypothetical protein